MQLADLLNLVANHPEARVFSPYRTLTLGRVYMMAKLDDSGSLDIMDNETGALVFRGSNDGISILVEGDWQNVLGESLKEAQENGDTEPTEPVEPNLATEGTTGEATDGGDGNLNPTARRSGLDTNPIGFGENQERVDEENEAVVQEEKLDEIRI